MRILAIAALASILAACVAGSQIVSFREALENPDGHNGKVIVRGVIYADPEQRSLHESFYAVDHEKNGQCIKLGSRNPLMRAQLDRSAGKMVRVKGRLVVDRCDPNDVCLTSCSDTGLLAESFEVLSR